MEEVCDGVDGLEELVGEAIGLWLGVVGAVPACDLLLILAYTARAETVPTLQHHRLTGLESFFTYSTLDHG